MFYCTRNVAQLIKVYRNVYKTHTSIRHIIHMVGSSYSGKRNSAWTPQVLTCHKLILCALFGKISGISCPCWNTTKPRHNLVVYFGQGWHEDAPANLLYVTVYWNYLHPWPLSLCSLLNDLNTFCDCSRLSSANSLEVTLHKLSEWTVPLKTS